MKRGFHWIGLLPDGRHALLYADPILKKTHTEVRTFPSHIEAIRYCRKNRIALASMQSAPHAELRLLHRELPRRQQDMYEALLRRADERGYAKATTRELMLECDLKDRGMIRAILNTLEMKGLAERIEAGWGDDPSTYRVAPKTKKPPPEGGGKGNSRTA